MFETAQCSFSFAASGDSCMKVVGLNRQEFAFSKHFPGARARNHAALALGALESSESSPTHFQTPKSSGIVARARSTAGRDSLSFSLISSFPAMSPRARMTELWQSTTVFGRALISESAFTNARPAMFSSESVPLLPISIPKTISELPSMAMPSFINQGRGPCPTVANPAKASNSISRSD